MLPIMDRYLKISRTVQTSEDYRRIWENYIKCCDRVLDLMKSLEPRQAAVVEQYIDAAFDVHMHMLYLALKETEK